MRIPEIQHRLNELSNEHSLPELAELANALRRRVAKKIAPATSTRMSDELRERIRELKDNSPSISQVEIARRFHVNPGRVSEALRGKRL